MSTCAKVLRCPRNCWNHRSCFSETLFKPSSASQFLNALLAFKIGCFPSDCDPIQPMVFISGFKRRSDHNHLNSVNLYVHPSFFGKERLSRESKKRMKHWFYFLLFLVWRCQRKASPQMLWSGCNHVVFWTELALTSTCTLLHSSEEAVELFIYRKPSFTVSLWANSILTKGLFSRRPE